MRQRLIECDDCGGTFWQPYERKSDPYPDECPLCHNTGEPVLRWPPKGHLSPRIAQMVEERRAPGAISNLARSAEMVYRSMESSSAERARMAAEHAGVPESEMSHLKITDLKDNMREGDIAAKLPTNPVAHAIRDGKNTGFQPQVIAPGGHAIGPSGDNQATINTIRNTTLQNFADRAALVRAGQLNR